MKKLLLVLASLPMFVASAHAADRDCIKYSAGDARAATQDDNTNTFSATYSTISGRKGNTNKDCAATADVEDVEESEEDTPTPSVTPKFPFDPEPEVPTHSGGSND